MDYQELWSEMKLILKILTTSGVHAVDPQTLTILMDQLEEKQRLKDKIIRKGIA